MPIEEGIKLPHTIKKTGEPNGITEMTLQNVVLNADIKDSLFE